MSEWITDALLVAGGWNALHPNDTPSWEQNGYDHNDIEKVFDRVKCVAMFPKAYASVAKEVETKAANCEKRGFNGAACSLYGRAMQLYGRAQYGYYADDPRKKIFHASLVKCFNKAAALSHIKMERVEFPFEGKKLYGNFYYGGKGEKQPCLLMLPGMDMVKEEWHGIVMRYAIPKGFVVLIVDQPGQGESLVNGLKVTLNNPERAGNTVLDYLETREEIDKEQIVLLGASMGSYWGSRWAAYNKRIKAASTVMACYGSKDITFKLAQPKFRNNFKFMSGIYDDKEFDEMSEQMILDEVAPQIECPFLMVQGEFDELTTIESTYEVYDMVKAPKEIWVLDNEFHPIGGMYGEIMSAILDWLANALSDQFKPGYAHGVYWKTNGEFVEGDGRPDWWSYSEWEQNKTI